MHAAAVAAMQSELRFCYRCQDNIVHEDEIECSLAARILASLTPYIQTGHLTALLIHLFANFTAIFIKTKYVTTTYYLNL